MAQIDVVLPVRFKLSPRAKKPFPLNLNTYRNEHPQRLNKAKIVFTAIAVRLIGKRRLTGQVAITYRLFFDSARRIDLSNVLSVADKFFSDALVSAGAIDDDNASILPEVNFVWGGVDPRNPRIEVTVEEITSRPIATIPLDPEPKEPQSMKIIIEQHELDALVHDYVASKLAPGQGFRIIPGADGIEIKLVNEPSVEAPKALGTSEPSVGKSDPDEKPPLDGEELTWTQKRAIAAAATRKANREAAAAADEASNQKILDAAESINALGRVPEPDTAREPEPVSADPLAHLRDDTGELRMATPEEWAAMSEEQQDLYNELINPEDETVVEAEPEAPAPVEPTPAPAVTEGRKAFVPAFLRDHQAKQAAAAEAEPKAGLVAPMDNVPEQPKPEPIAAAVEAAAEPPKRNALFGHLKRPGK